MWRIIRRIAAWSLAVSLVCTALWPVIIDYRPEEGARSRQCNNDLRGQIGPGLASFHDSQGSFPPAFIADEHGRPIHSWRTLVSPFADQIQFYNRYSFDEPWDGDQNKELLKEFRGRPFVSAYPEDGTYAKYLAVVGPDAAWPGSRPAKLDEDFPDGAANTIIVVEVVNSGIQWTEPRDIQLAEMSFKVNDPVGKSISSPHRKRGAWPWSGTARWAHVLLGDGSVKRLPAETDPKIIRAMLTANGGESASLPP